MLDLIDEVRAPFDPEVVVARFAKTLKEFGCPVSGRRPLCRGMATLTFQRAQHLVRDGETDTQRALRRAATADHLAALDVHTIH